MNNEQGLLNRISSILIDFSDYEKAEISFNSDIIIRKKINNKKNKKESILTNVFKEMIAKDLKKTGFK